VKVVVRVLLSTLKKEMLIIDWRKWRQTRAAVRLSIEEGPDSLSETYTRDI